VRFPEILLLFLLAAPGPRPDLLPGEEHLPLRTKAPAPGQLPDALKPHAERVGTPARSDADRLFDRLADRLLARELEGAPITATALGIHDYDALLPATDTLVIARNLALREELRARIARLDSSALEPARRAERAQLLDRLDAMPRGDRWWSTDPERSIAIVSDGLNSLLAADFAPIDSRGWNAVARLTEVPGVLRNARAALAHPARADVEAAIPSARALALYLANGITVQMAAVRDPVLREEFDHHLAAAAGAAADFHTWLGSTLLPQAGPGPSVAAARQAADARGRDLIAFLLRPQ